MKKIWALLLVMVFSLGLVGCGGDKDKDAQKEPADTKTPPAQVDTLKPDQPKEDVKKNADAQTIVVANEEELKEQVMKQAAQLLEPGAKFICEVHYEKGEGAVLKLMMNTLDIKGDLSKEAVWQAHTNLLKEISKFKGDYKYIVIWNGNKGQVPDKKQERGYAPVLKTVILSEEMGKIDFKDFTPEALQKLAVEFHIDAALK